MIRKEILQEVIESQRKWIIQFGKGIERDKLKDIKLSASFAVVISGIRRCGKSTLLSQLLKRQKKFYYLNLEDPRLNNFELDDFNKADQIFRERYGKNCPYFFDEIQNIPEWEKFVRFLIDNKKEVVITGSNASLLSKELGTKLTGRHLRIELFPFSYNEYLRFFNSKTSVESFNKYLYKGGFPEFLKMDNPAIHHELLKDVVSRDIAVKFGIKNISILNKLVAYLISHTGKEFSYNSLKKMFDIKSVQTVIDYISYFEDAYLIFVINKFSYSYKKQQVNPKKVYSIDNGFSYSNSVSFSKDKGRMLENNVFLNLRRNYSEIYYYSEKAECDFIIKEKEKIIQVIQVCYHLNKDNEKREIEGLLESMRKFNLKEGLILTNNQEDILEIDGKKIYVKPVWQWLAI